ncbi:uncharacterized protein IL334_002734 [Kwoniella shivajii]|uniref:Mitochondrial adapter protein MCP1 transmembrane domain-containing protein n=1 Tax=Kwoniella shivajii TaxID=564305 RepID=A0ABZ1CVJ1_9TREE|nr:hypothetical protein IL334_002734 [Kwoniella shivajii]
MSPPPPGIPLPHESSRDPLSDKSSFPNLHSSLPRRSTILGYLTLSQNTSAMIFTIFLIPHLASPIAACVTGLEGAQQTMMIGRDLYLPLERYLIYIPLSVHVASSILRRIVITLPSSQTPTINPKQSSSWSSMIQRVKSKLPKQTHQIVAYPLSLMVLSHLLTHRIIPSYNQSPILALSPSELSWEFVGHNLTHYSAWLSYLTLVGSASWHGLVGSMKIVNWLKGSRKNTISNGKGDEPHATSVESKAEGRRNIIPRTRKIGLRATITFLLGIVTVGLVRVAKDTGPISGIMKSRYEAVFAAAPWTRLWR